MFEKDETMVSVSDVRIAVLRANAQRRRAFVKVVMVHVKKTMLLNVR
jgi:hypothetical protein